MRARRDVQRAPASRVRCVACSTQQQQRLNRTRAVGSRMMALRSFVAALIAATAQLLGCHSLDNGLASTPPVRTPPLRCLPSVRAGGQPSEHFPPCPPVYVSRLPAPRWPSAPLPIHPLSSRQWVGCAYDITGAVPMCVSVRPFCRWAGALGVRRAPLALALRPMAAAAHLLWCTQTASAWISAPRSSSGKSMQ